MRRKRLNNPFNLVKVFFQPDDNLDDNQEDISFSQICKFIRKTFDVTQSDMATKLSVTLQGYSFWEAGKRSPSSKAAFNLCLMYLQAIEFTKIGNLEKSQLLDIFDNLHIFEHFTAIRIKYDSSLDLANKEHN